MRGDFPSSAPKARNALRSQEETACQRNDQPPGPAPAQHLPCGKKAPLPGDKTPPNWSWWWVTFGEQSRVISRECRSSIVIQPCTALVTKGLWLSRIGFRIKWPPHAWRIGESLIARVVKALSPFLEVESFDVGRLSGRAALENSSVSSHLRKPDPQAGVRV